MLDPVARRRPASSACLRSLMSLHEPTTSAGSPLVIADQALLVVDPAPAAVLPEESVFDGMAPGGEQAGRFGLDRGEIFGMHPATPEVGVLQIIPGLVAEQVAQISLTNVGA